MKIESLDYNFYESLKKLIDAWDEIGHHVTTEDRELNESLAFISKGVDRFMKVICGRFRVTYPPKVGQFYTGEDLKETLDSIQSKAKEGKRGG